MRFTKACEYALTALAHVARLPEGAVFSISEVARVSRLPAPYLAKIFTKLVQAGLLNSSRGRSSGFSLAHPAGAISVKAAVEAIDGPTAFQKCIFVQSLCSEESPCVLHDQWKGFRGPLERNMAAITLLDLGRLGEGAR